jgi:hypothetical protein
MRIESVVLWWHLRARKALADSKTQLTCSMARKVEPEETAAYFDHTVVGG